MHRFEELKIWQKSMDVTEDCYKVTENFPKEEKYGLTSQLRRSAVSIPSNIAEGAGRNTNAEFRQFLGIVNGSSFELLAQLYLSKRLNLTSEERVKPIIDEVVQVTKNFPKEEKYGLTSQLRRSAVSIPSNIAEGAGRNTNAEFRQFLGIVNGSSFELLAQLYLSKRLNLTSEERVKPIIDEVVQVTKMNYSPQKTLKKRLDTHYQRS